jgi:hypothetical protein
MSFSDRTLSVEVLSFGMVAPVRSGETEEVEEVTVRANDFGGNNNLLFPHIPTHEKKKKSFLASFPVDIISSGQHAGLTNSRIRLSPPIGVPVGGDEGGTNRVVDVVCARARARDQTRRKSCISSYFFLFLSNTTPPPNPYPRL